MEERHWRFGFNDPSLSGWVITAGYCIAFFLCLWAGAKAKRSAANARSNGPSAAGGGLWLLFSAILFLLGVNKQLDLQTLLGDVGRELSSAQGWYENRRAAQAAFVAVFALGCGILALRIAKRSGRRRGGHGVASAGMILLILVVVVRAGFLEHALDTLPHGRTAIPRPVFSLAELSSIFLAGLGALIALVRERAARTREFRFDWEKE